jgi:hypothetical protein
MGWRETLALRRPQKIIRTAHTPLKSDFYNKIGPKRTHAPQQNESLFDHLVGSNDLLEHSAPSGLTKRPVDTASSAGDQPQPRRCVEGAHQQIHQRHSAHRR